MKKVIQIFVLFFVSMPQLFAAESADVAIKIGDICDSSNACKKACKMNLEEKMVNNQLESLGIDDQALIIKCAQDISKKVSSPK